MRRTGEWRIVSVNKEDKLVGYSVAELQKGVILWAAVCLWHKKYRVLCVERMDAV